MSNVGHVDMIHSVVTGRLDGLVARASIGVVAIGAELALLVGYVGLTGAAATDVRYLLYPFVWINLALWAVLVTEPPDASPRLRRVVLVGAAGYLLVLAYAGGVLELSHLGHSHRHGTPSGFVVFTSLPPGWGPTLVYDHAAFTVTLVPYQFVGYLALTYLVYVAVLDTATAALSGAIGLLSCVSCSWPVFASLLAGVVGGSAIASTMYSFSVDLSTAAFVVAVGLLLWRPGPG